MAQLSQAVDGPCALDLARLGISSWLLMRGAGAVVMSHGTRLLLNVSGGGEEE